MHSSETWNLRAWFPRQKCVIFLRKCSVTGKDDDPSVRQKNNVKSYPCNNIYRLDRNTNSTSCRVLWPAPCCETIGNSIPGMNLTYPNARKQRKQKKWETCGVLTHSHFFCLCFIVFWHVDRWGTSPELRSTWFLRHWDRHQVPNLAFSRMPKNPTLTAFFLLKKQVNPMSSNFRPNAENPGARKQFQGCRIPRLHRSKVTWFQESTIASLHGFKATRFQNSRVAGFQTFPGFQGCNVTGQKFQASQGWGFPRF